MVSLTSDTLLHRQISPAWTQRGHVTSQAFKPTSKDERRLSVYDGDQVSAEESWKHFTEELGLTSAGVLAVSVEECESLGLDAEQDPEPFLSHAVILFGGLSNSQVETKAKILKRNAVARGWLYKEDPADADQEE